MRKKWAWALAWLAGVLVLVTVGVVTVSNVGASIRGRGPLGNEVIRNAELADGSLRPSDLPTGVARVQKEIAEEFGTFVVACEGVYAFGVEARPDTAAGWRVVSFEPGPDDDVDAVFSNGARSIEIEVFCNRGKPTISDLEFNELLED
ncbi:hypothetical protein [Nocardioides daejeonensis]|uniref:hypothetical protein n=1 Tax=Nocardioides daejeonensis TaxID=1046556 RepID=UPI0013A567BE|nr:hypothetical protein [Nocardioides daejeonensis]